MECQLTQNISVRQEQNVQQIIELSSMLSLPVGVMESVLEKVVENPHGVEKLLIDRKHETHELKTRAIFGELVSNKQSGIKPNSGIIPSFKLNELEGIVDGIEPVVITPDIIYTGVNEGNPRMHFADYLDTKPELKINLVGKEFPNARKFYNLLLFQRVWISSKLREAYSELRDVQREFINTLNPTQLHIFLQENLGESVNLHYTTISRLVKNRYVQINSDGKTEVHPFFHLLPTSDDVFRYQFVEKLNRTFSEEFKNKTVFSDEEIRVSLRRIARRTIAKYREGSKIPNKSERKKIYSENQLVKPYQIPFFGN
ncbi:hypothetical protein J4474_02410 [Candidatus Pacearchaeota archaeon]|nr:hypothetical protein [Candidatus Pacearchaeota archaeon]